MDWGLAKVLRQGGTADEPPPQPDEAAVSVIRTVARGSDADKPRPGSVTGARRPTWRRSRPAATWRRSTSGPTSSGWGRSCARSSRGSRRTPVRRPTRFCARRCVATRPTPCGGWMAAGPTSSSSALARECLRSRVTSGRGMRAQVARQMTAYLAGVQERLRAAELARAAEAAPSRRGPGDRRGSRGARTGRAAGAADDRRAGCVRLGRRCARRRRVDVDRAGPGRASRGAVGPGQHGFARGDGAQGPGPGGGSRGPRCLDQGAGRGREGPRAARARPGHRRCIARSRPCWRRSPARRKEPRRPPERRIRTGCCWISWSTSARPRPTIRTARSAIGITPRRSGRPGSTSRHCRRPRWAPGSRPVPATVAAAMAAALDDWAAVRRSRRYDRPGALTAVPGGDCSGPRPMAGRPPPGARPGRPRGTGQGAARPGRDDEARERSRRRSRPAGNGPV